jgi:hypothetical protein
MCKHNPEGFAERDQRLISLAFLDRAAPYRGHRMLPGFMCFRSRTSSSDNGVYYYNIPWKLKNKRGNEHYDWGLAVCDLVCRWGTTRVEEIFYVRCEQIRWITRTFLLLPRG